MVPKNILVKIFHASVIALNVYALWYDQNYVDLPSPSKVIDDMLLKARYIFFTLWCLVLQTLYFSVSLLNDFYGTDALSPKNPPKIRKIKDVLFVISFTMVVYLTTVFWGVYNINKELIFPDEVERIMPKWLNHVMHTFVLLFIFIELLVTKRSGPSRSFGFAMTMVFAWGYAIWLHILYFKTGLWVYPCMGELNWPIRFIYFVCSTCISYCIYVFGEYLSNLVSNKGKVYSNIVNGNAKKIK